MRLNRYQKLFSTHNQKVIHGWRDPLYIYPLFIDGEQSALIDMYGERYIDLDSQALVNIIGYKNEDIIQKMNCSPKTGQCNKVKFGLP